MGITCSTISQQDLKKGGKINNKSSPVKKDNLNDFKFPIKNSEETTNTTTKEERTVTTNITAIDSKKEPATYTSTTTTTVTANSNGESVQVTIHTQSTSKLERYSSVSSVYQALQKQHSSQVLLEGFRRPMPTVERISTLNCLNYQNYVQQQQKEIDNEKC